MSGKGTSYLHSIRSPLIVFRKRLSSAVTTVPSGPLFLEILSGLLHHEREIQTNRASEIRDLAAGKRLVLALP